VTKSHPDGRFNVAVVCIHSVYIVNGCQCLEIVVTETVQRIGLAVYIVSLRKIIRLWSAIDNRGMELQ